MNTKTEGEAAIARINTRTKELFVESKEFKKQALRAAPERGEESAFYSWVVQKISGLQIIGENLAEECERQRMRLALSENRRR